MTVTSHKNNEVHANINIKLVNYFYLWMQLIRFHETSERELFSAY